VAKQSVFDHLFKVFAFSVFYPPYPPLPSGVHPKGVDSGYIFPLSFYCPSELFLLFQA
jgi:hypothetical protein